MTIAKVQSHVTGNSGTTFLASISLTNPPSAGNVLILDCGSRSSPFVIDIPAGWTSLVSNLFPANDNYAHTIMGKVSDGTDQTVTFSNVSNGAPESATISEWSGFAGLLPAVDTSATDDITADATPAIPAVTPTTGIEILLIASVWKTNADPNPGPVTLSGYTLLEDTGYALFGNQHRLTDWYRVVASATGTYGPTSTSSSGSNNDSNVIHVALKAGVPDPVPGFWIDFEKSEWNGTHDNVTSDLMSATVTRGVPGDLTGATGAGGGSFVLKDPLGIYNPQNASSPLFGLLKDGLRVWAGLTATGLLSGAGTVYGILAGYVTDITPIPSPGNDDPATVEFTFEDPLAWFGRAKVQLADSRTRSQADLRDEVLDALGVTQTVLPAEPTTMPLSSADGYADNILSELNSSNGTRHYARPHDTRNYWWQYVAVRRTEHLDGVATASLTGSDHANTDGWRTSADTVINQQRATITPIIFREGRVVAWEETSAPFTITSTKVIWVDFPDYVDAPVVNLVSSGSAVTATLVPFGRTAKLTLATAGTSSINKLTIDGYLVERGQGLAYVKDDATSQVAPRGVRAGPDLASDYIGIDVSARGIADHIVWRYGDPKVRPSLTVQNWFPQMLSLDPLDVLSFTSTHLSVTDMLFDIVGATFAMEWAAAVGKVLHTVTYQLQESKVQVATSWFTWDVSQWNDAASPWAY